MIATSKVYFEYYISNELMDKLMSEKGVCRTASATPGLLTKAAHCAAYDKVSI